MKLREDSYKEMIEKMIHRNLELKHKFETYDSTKDKFYQDMIGELENEHQSNLGG